jgi:hypothetical protein
MDELLNQAGQQALIDAAAAKAAHEIRLKSVAPKRTADSDSSSTADFSTADFALAPVRPHAAHGHRGDPDSDDEHERLLTAAQVKRRYGGVSDLWLWRRLRDESGFPKPIFICRRRFWRLSALIAWERSRSVGAA